MSDTEAIGPCPFCGDTEHVSASRHGNTWAVGCYVCESLGSSLCKSEAEAIAAWNKPTSERAKVLAEVARLAKDYNAVRDALDATIQSQHTAQKPVERAYKDALLALSSASEYAYEQHQRAEQAEARVRELRGQR